MRVLSNRNDIIGLLMVFISVLGAFARSSLLHFDNTFLNWGVTFSCIFLCFKYAYSYSLFFSKTLIPCGIFLLWALYGAIAGVTYVDNYWIAKQWLLGITCVSLPCLSYIFYNPNKTLLILRTWNLWIFPLFLLIIWIIEKDAIHFCFGPVFCLYGLFWMWLPKKWKCWTAFFLFFMITGDIHARSQVITGLLCILFAIAIKYDKFIPKAIIHTIPWSFYILAITLLYLGFSGTYNVFNHDEKRGLIYEMVFSNGDFSGDEKVIGEQALTDTRSPIYVEVIESAINNDYVIFGRTLARGNDSELFSTDSYTGRQERYANELCHLNIFTWLGLFGLLLYTIIYIVATWLAAYRSQNIYISYLGVLVAFHWAFGWIEDMNKFDSLNIGLWLIIAMCLSPKFRRMSNFEFQIWFKSIFTEKKISSYTTYNLLKLRLRMHLKNLKK